MSFADPALQLTPEKKAMEAGLASMTSNVKSRLEVKTKRSAYPSVLKRTDNMMLILLAHRGDT